MGYAQAIDKLISRGQWTPVYHKDFNKCKSYGHSIFINGSGAANFERYSLLVFRKNERQTFGKAVN